MRKQPRTSSGAVAVAMLASLLGAAGAGAQHLDRGPDAATGAHGPRLSAGRESGASASPAATDEIRGLVEARNEAVLSSQIEGRILRLPFRAGEAFVRGDTLVEFDCAMHRARLAAARAGLSAARKTHENNRELEGLAAISKLEVELSAAEVEKSAAEVEVARVEVSRCTITAPYDGRVVEQAVNEHESVSANQELLRVLDDTQLEIALLVPSTWLTWLAPGARFEFRVDETGRSYPAAVARVGASVDPVSQTVRLEAVFPGNPEDVLAGMSGVARFDAVPAAPAGP